VWRFLTIAAAVHYSGCTIVTRANRTEHPRSLSEREKRILALEELRAMRILDQKEFDAEMKFVQVAE